MNPQTDTIYVPGASGNLSFINGRTNKVTATISVGSSAAAAAVNPQTGTVFATIIHDSAVAVINARKDTVAGTIPVGHFPTDVAVDPATSRVYVSNRLSNTLSVLACPPR